MSIEKKKTGVKKSAEKKVNGKIVSVEAQQPSEKEVVSPAIVESKRKTVRKKRAVSRKKDVVTKATGAGGFATVKESTAKESPEVPAQKVVPRASLASLFGERRQEEVFSETPPEWVKPEWVPFYCHLYELWSRLKHQMTGLAEDSTQEISSFGMHMADTGTDHFDRDFALSLLSADQDSIFEIEQALKRIQKGTYGICEMTGKPISHDRLEAIPWTRFTVEAQAQLEKEGALNKRRKIGDLGMLNTSGSDDLAAGMSSEEEKDVEDKLASDRE